MRTCSSTSGAGRSCSTTTPASTSRGSPTRRGLPAWVNAGCAIWLDYDRDGRLDLFLAGYWPDDVDLWHLETTKMMPESFEYAQNGGGKYLFRNKGDGTFEDVTDEDGHRQPSLGPGRGRRADLRGTGYPDLFVANDYGVSELFANRERENVPRDRQADRHRLRPQERHERRLRRHLQPGPALGLRDQHLRGGRADPGQQPVGAEGGRTGDTLQYENLASSLGVELGGWSFGAQFGDLNNDGTQDLFLTNGYVSAAKGTSYWYEFSMVAGGNSVDHLRRRELAADAGQEPLGLPAEERLAQRRGGTFIEVARRRLHDPYDGRAVALVDLWNRGVLDVLVANQTGRS